MENSNKLVIVGLGHMGGAILDGLLANNYNPKNITAVVVDDAAKEKAKSLGINFVTNPDKLPTDINIILFSIKPQIMSKIVPLYKKFINSALFISIAAGQTISKMTSMLSSDAAIVRSMPNMAATVGKSMTVLTCNSKVSNKQKQISENLMQSIGETAWLDDENLMDAVTAVSGSGPAYFFLLAELLAKAGVDQGLPKELAQKLANITLYGAGAMSFSGTDIVNIAELRESVTSKGGTTAAALDVLCDNDLTYIIQKAVKAATKRGMELSL